MEFGSAFVVVPHPTYFESFSVEPAAELALSRGNDLGALLVRKIFSERQTAGAKPLSEVETCDDPLGLLGVTGYDDG
jgi:hypothetical protein